MEELLLKVVNLGFNIPKNIDHAEYLVLCEMQQWLRKIHKIKVLVIHSPSGMYNYEIYKWNFNNDKGIWERIGNVSHYETYELALEEGLKHSLTLIK